MAETSTIAWEGDQALVSYLVSRSCEQAHGIDRLAEATERARRASQMHHREPVRTEAPFFVDIMDYGREQKAPNSTACANCRDIIEEDDRRLTCAEELRQVITGRIEVGCRAHAAPSHNGVQSVATSGPIHDHSMGVALAQREAARG